MHYFQEDVSRCFSEQAKVFSKELNLPLNTGREVWARVHGCDNAHEALQKIKNGDSEFGESVIASIRTLGRFPGDGFVGQFAPYFRRGEGMTLQHDALDNLDRKKVEQAALKAKGVPRRWSKGLAEEKLFGGHNGPHDLILDELVNRGGIYIAIDGKGIDRFADLYQITGNYRRQRRVKGVFLGFHEWINDEHFVHNIRSERVFDVWTLKELEALFKVQLRPIRNFESEATMWSDRAYVAAKAILGLISVVRKDIRLDEFSSCFNLDGVLEMRERAIAEGKEKDTKDAKIIHRLTQFLWSLPGFTEEDCALGALNPECYKQFGFLSMQFTSFIDALTEDNNIKASNLFPDMSVPVEKDKLPSYIDLLKDILKSLPDYSFVFIDTRREGVEPEVVEQIIEACKNHRVYAIWCGGASVEEQEAMHNFYDELFEVTEENLLRPFF